jgi:hypothetical protein
MLTSFLSRQPFSDLWVHVNDPAGQQALILDGRRPGIPETCPAEYRELIEWCWHQDPSARPSFPLILGNSDVLALVLFWLSHSSSMYNDLLCPLFLESP